MGFLSSSTSNSSASTGSSAAISSAEYFAAEHRASMAAQTGRTTPLSLSEPPRPTQQPKTKVHGQKSNPLDTLTEAILGTSRAMENWQLKMDKRKMTKAQKARDEPPRSSGWGLRSLKGDFLKSKSDFRTKSEIWH